MARDASPEEEEFRAGLDELEQDARAAARFTYAAETIDYLRNQRPTLMATLDRDAGFWDTVLGALQTASIAALARLYDPRNEVMSAARVLDYASTHAAALFNPTALQSRQARAGNGGDAAHPDVEGYRCGIENFAGLRAALDEHTALYEYAIRPIRYELFTESGRRSLLETLALFQIVEKADFQKLALFPSSLHGALRRLFQEGRKPLLDEAPADVAGLIASPAGERDADPWEQGCMVRDAWRFLTGLEDAEMPANEAARRDRYED